jgi:molecular chaperone DnaK
MTVTGGSALPKDDIDRMVREAEQHAEEDRLRRETAETRNQAEQLVYQTEKFVRENGDRIPADTKSEVESAVAELKEQLKQQADTAALRAGIDKLSSVSQKMGQPMYEQAQPSAAGGSAGTEGTAGSAGTTGSAGTSGDEGVVDAEIVDDDGSSQAG